MKNTIKINLKNTTYKQFKGKIYDLKLSEIEFCNEKYLYNFSDGSLYKVPTSSVDELYRTMKNKEVILNRINIRKAREIIKYATRGECSIKEKINVYNRHKLMLRMKGRI